LENKDSEKLENKDAGRFYILLVIEGLLVFSLGVFGNKLAEILNISSTVVLVGTLLLIFLLLALTISRVRYEKGQEIIPSKLKRTLLDTIIIVFPSALIVGIVLGLISIVLTGNNRPVVMVDAFQTNNYEVISVVISLVFIYFLSKRNRKYSLVLTFALGLSLGLSGIFVFILPQQNNPYYTFGGLILIISLCSILINSNIFHNLINNFIKLFQSSQDSNS
jgi:hypothetical protein